MIIIRRNDGQRRLAGIGWVAATAGQPLAAGRWLLAAGSGRLTKAYQATINAVDPHSPPGNHDRRRGIVRNLRRTARSAINLLFIF